jgi:hypothetical protein
LKLHQLLDTFVRPWSVFLPTSIVIRRKLLLFLDYNLFKGFRRLLQVRLPETLAVVIGIFCVTKNQFFTRRGGGWKVLRKEYEMRSSERMILYGMA